MTAKWSRWRHLEARFVTILTIRFKGALVPAWPADRSRTRTGPVEADGAVDAQNAPTAPWKTLLVFHELPQGFPHQITHDKPRKSPESYWETRIDPSRTRRGGPLHRADRCAESARRSYRLASRAHIAPRPKTPHCSSPVHSHRSRCNAPPHSASSPWQKPRCIRPALKPAWTALLLGRQCPIYLLPRRAWPVAAPRSVRHGVLPRAARPSARYTAKRSWPARGRRRTRTCRSTS